MGKGRELARIYVPILFSLLLLLPLGAFYSALLKRQQASLDRRVFQLLDRNSRNLVRVLRGYDQTLREAPLVAQEFLLRQRFELWRTVSQSQVHGCETEVECEVEAYLRNSILGLDRVEFSRPGSWLSKPRGVQETDICTAVGLPGDGISGARMQFSLARMAGDGKELGRLRISLPIDRVVERVRDPETFTLLDSLLLASSTGEVFVQENHEAVRVEKLGSILARRVTNGEPQSELDERAGSALVVRARDVDELRFTQRVAELAGSTSKTEVTLQGKSYLVYVEPVGIQLSIQSAAAKGPLPGGAPRPESLVVAGLLKKTSFDVNSGAVPYVRLLGVTAFLLGLLGIVWPLLRLQTMSKTERLTRWSIRRMFLGFVAALFLLALLYLSWGFSITLQQRTFARLSSIARNLESNFNGEVVQILDTLVELSERLRLDRARQSRDDRALPRWQTTLAEQTRNFDVMTLPYPFLNEVVLLNEAEQVVRLSNSPFIPPLRRLEEHDRETISRLSRADAPRLIVRRQNPGPLSSKTEEIAFMIDPSASSQSGEHLGVITTTAHDFSDGVQYVQAVTKFRSLVDPILPFGMSYAIIDREGAVLFHSDKQRAQSENFLAECDEPDKLRTLVTRRQSDTMTSNYRGVRQLFHIRPLRSSQTAEKGAAVQTNGIDRLDWTLIVFRDLSYIDALVLRNGSLFLLCLALTFLAYLFFRGGRALFQTRKGRALYYVLDFFDHTEHWPRDSCRPQYAIVTLLGLAAMLLIPVILIFSQPNGLAFVSCTLLAMGLLFAGGIFAAVRKAEAWKRVQHWAVSRVPFGNLPLVYAVHATTFLLALTTCISVLEFQASLNETQYSHRYLSRRSALERISAKEKITLSEVAQTGLPKATVERYEKGMLALHLDNYEYFSTAKGCQLLRDLSGLPQVQIPRELAGFLSRNVTSDAYGTLLGLVGGSEESEVCPGPNTGPNLPTDDPETNAMGAWPALPSLLTSTGDSAIFYLGGFAIALILFTLIYRMCRRLFGLDEFEDPKPLPVRRSVMEALSDPEWTVDRPLLILHQPGSGVTTELKKLGGLPDLAKKLGLPHHAVRLIDVAEEKSNLSTEQIREELLKLTLGAQIVLVDNLEFRLEEPTVRAIKLAFLEVIVSRRIRVVLFSTVDPADNIALLRPSESRSLGELDHARWIRLFGKFRSACLVKSVALQWNTNKPLRVLVENGFESVATKTTIPHEYYRAETVVGDVLNSLTQGVPAKLDKELNLVADLLEKTKRSGAELRLAKLSIIPRLRRLNPAPLEPIVRQLNELRGLLPGIMLKDCERLLKELLSEFEVAKYDLTWTHLDPNGNPVHCLQPYFDEIANEIQDSDYLSRRHPELLEKTLDDLNPQERKSPEAVRRRLARHARGPAEFYYRILWNSTTLDERLALYQLSKDRWANPKNHDAIAHLIKRRLMFREDGPYRVMSRSFEWFVAKSPREAEINEWLSDQRSSRWPVLRMALVSGVIVVAGWFIYVRQDLLQSYLSFFAALAAGGAGVLQLINEVYRQRSTPAPSPEPDAKQQPKK